MKPFIIINLDRIYRLRLTIGVILEYEQIEKKPLASARLDDENTILILLWLMLKRELPELTLTGTARKMAKLKTTVPLIIAVSEAITNAFTKKKSKKETKPDFYDVTEHIKLAMEIGLKIDEFLDMTPAEFSLRLETEIKNRKIHRNETMKQAWYTAYLHRVKSEHFPKLETLLVDVDETTVKEMTDDEMLNQCRIITAAFGGKVIYDCD